MLHKLKQKKLKQNNLILLLVKFLSVLLLSACQVTKNEKQKVYKYFLVFERSRVVDEKKHEVNANITYYIISDTSLSLNKIVKRLTNKQFIQKSNIFSVVDHGDYQSLIGCKFPFSIDYNDTLGSVLYQVFYIGHSNPLFNYYENTCASNETEFLIGEVICKYPIVPMKDKFLNCINRNKTFLLNIEDNNYIKFNDTLSLLSDKK